MKPDKQHENRISLMELSYRMSYNASYKREQTYAYNTYSGNLENVLEVCKELGISFEAFYPFDYGYIPLDPFCTDEPLKEYLISLHQKETDLFLKEYGDKTGIEGLFCTKFEFSIYLSGWAAYLDELRIKKAIDWCKQYGIQYTTDMPLYNEDGTIGKWIQLNRATQTNVNRIVNQSQSQSNQSGDG